MLRSLTNQIDTLDQDCTLSCIARKANCKADCTQERHLFRSTKHPHHTYPFYETMCHLMMFHTYK